MSDSATKRKIVVLGAGGTGLLLAESITRCAADEFGGFLDDDPAKQAAGYCGYPVLGGLAGWREQAADVRFLNSLYSPKRMAFFADLVAGLGIPDTRWATVVDPHAVVSGQAVLAPGVFVGPGAVVEPYVTVGRLSLLYGAVYLAHHVTLGEFVLCANSAALAGGVTVGGASYIGVNASIREYTTIGSRAVVGMGAVVLNDVPDEITVVGNPARPLAVARP